MFLIFRLSIFYYLYFTGGYSFQQRGGGAVNCLINFWLCIILFFLLYFCIFYFQTTKQNWSLLEATLFYRDEEGLKFPDSFCIFPFSICIFVFFLYQYLMLNLTRFASTKQVKSILLGKYFADYVLYWEARWYQTWITKADVCYSFKGKEHFQNPVKIWKHRQGFW